MNNPLNTLPTKTGRQTFIIFTLAVLIIQIALFIVLNFYWRTKPQHITPTRVATEITRIVAIAKVMPAKQLAKHNKLLNRAGFHVTIASQANAKAQQLTHFNPRAIRQIALTQPTFFISAPLNENQWINIRHTPPHLPQLWNIGFILIITILILTLLTLCYWAIKQVAFPLEHLVKAVKRFSKDMQAPPLPESGPDEMQDLSRAFNSMQQHLRKLLQDRTQMLAAISHDLRTPLTRLQLRAEYLQGTPQYDKALNDIKEMEQMITSILFFARDDARSGIKERFDLNALLTSLCNDMIDSGKTVHFTENSQRIPFYGNISTLKRAFNNLIENAIKYGKQAEVSLTQENQSLKIKITDQGPGIPDDQLDKVFTPFYRVDPARSPQISGSGLGLAVARDIISAHGGEVTLSNRAQGGLRVLVSI